MSNDKRKVYVVGHKNPDTDSICTAIAYANLKTKLTQIRHEPRRAGQLNEETQYVLERFGVKVPLLLSDLREQIKDVDLRESEEINGNLSIRTAWEKMTEMNTHTLPITRDGMLEGVITKGDIAKSYMDVYDNTMLAKARTQYRNIAAAVEGKVETGNEHGYFQKGKVAIAASGKNLMTRFIEKDDLVIMGDRVDAQQCAIDMDASCMVICQGYPISEDILRQAEKKQIVVIRTPHDTFTAAQHINQSIPVRFFMTRENLVTFHIRDFVDDVKEVMARKRFRDFPVLGNQGKFVGLVSRRRLLNVKKKQVILVDHNEKNQAVDGVEEADVLEIIDHHRLSSIETMGPVYFRNQPVGCTATIVYQMYEENGIAVDAVNAALLCSAIISDTLMFRSPTCTAMDKAAAEKLAEIAGVKCEELASEMFAAGSNLKNKSPEEIFYQDFKKFELNKSSFGVGQITSVNADELTEIKKELLPYMEKALGSHGESMLFFMLTDIINESTELLFYGGDSKNVVSEAFHKEPQEGEQSVILPGVVSRKKQLIPSFMTAMQQ